MCGFVGIIASPQSTPLGPKVITSALKAIEHRGPDYKATWVSADCSVTVGHARLAIIDPSEAANQPMVSRDGRFVLVFNGEIYNYRDLYRRFVADEDGVNPNSDTSVLLGLLRSRGRNAIPLLNGMFAFAFVDLKNRSVLVARDRFGEKPVYYLHDEQKFAFASELTALRTLCSERSWRLSQDAVRLYFMCGSVAPPLTIFEGVKALPPGSSLSWRLGSTPSVATYWSLNNLLPPDSARPPTVQTVSNLLQRAVASRMVSDVPVGIFLSGGIDSNSIVATAASQASRIDVALCIDFSEVEYSESEVASAVAKQYGIRFERDVIDSRHFSHALPDFFQAMDQPTVDGFNTFFIARTAAQTGVKVWLSGVGGDELFGGYPSFERLSRLERISKFLQLIVPNAAADSISANVGLSRQARFLHLAVDGNATLRAYQVCRTPILPAACRRLLLRTPELSRSCLQRLLDSVFPEPAAALDAFQRASLLEVTTYLGAQLLRDIDNFSMIESIEVRAPYLDHELFEQVWQLPQGLKKYSASLKSLLIDAVPGGLPSVVSTRRKRGFTFPMQKWLRHTMERQFQDIVLDQEFETLWRRDEVRELWTSYMAGKIGWMPPWSFFVFANWRHAHSC